MRLLLTQQFHKSLPFPRNVLRKVVHANWNQTFFYIVQNCFKQNKYELVIDGQGLGRSGFLTWMTGAPRRIGPSNAREYGWLGYTDRVEVTSKHTVDNMLELVERLGDSASSRHATLCKRRRSIRGGRNFQEEHRHWIHYVVLAPTSRWKSKQWPVERFYRSRKKIYKNADTKSSLLEHQVNCNK